MITDNLGFCVIRKDILNSEDLNFIEKKIRFFDISISQINQYKPNKVLSVQSIFYNSDLTNVSLVKSEKEFIKLKKIFETNCELISKNGFNSIIFGAPSVRINPTISNIKLKNRLTELIALSRSFSINLYFEALPKKISDVLNYHEELIDLNNGNIHFDSATWIENKRNFKDLKKIIKNIDRFHLSIPDYRNDLWNFPEIKIICQLLINENLKAQLKFIEMQIQNVF